MLHYTPLCSITPRYAPFHTVMLCSTLLDNYFLNTILKATLNVWHYQHIYVFEQFFFIIYHPVGKNGHKNYLFLIIKTYELFCFCFKNKKYNYGIRDKCYCSLLKCCDNYVCPYQGGIHLQRVSEQYTHNYYFLSH